MITIKIQKSVEKSKDMTGACVLSVDIFQMTAGASVTASWSPRAAPTTLFLSASCPVHEAYSMRVWR